MKRKFKVTITYDVELEDPDANDNVTIGSVAGLHIMDAVYASQVGNDQGWTSVNPRLAYVTTEETMSWQEVK